MDCWEGDDKREGEDDEDDDAGVEGGGKYWESFLVIVMAEGSLWELALPMLSLTQDGYLSRVTINIEWEATKTYQTTTSKQQGEICNE